MSNDLEDPENGVLEDTDRTDDDEGHRDDEYPETSSETVGDKFGLTGAYDTHADKNPYFEASCAYGINVHGNLILDLDPARLLEQGFEVGDILTVSINGVAYDLALAKKINEVPVGESCIYQVVFQGRDLLAFCTNGASFVEEHGLTHAVTGVRVNVWRVRPWAYGLYPHILDSHTDVYPWHWDWWA